MVRISHTQLGQRDISHHVSGVRIVQRIQPYSGRYRSRTRYCASGCFQLLLSCYKNAFACAFEHTTVNTF